MDKQNDVFTYIGDPADDFSGPTVIDIFGYEFKKGVAAKVDDAKAAKKLAGHSHFIRDGQEMPQGAKGGADDELPAMKLEELKAVATAENVAFPSNATRKMLVELIRDAREGDED